jgi:hypothetical protein
MNATMKAVDLPNVHGRPEDAGDATIISAIVHPTISEVIWELATKNPLWQFYPTGATRMNERKTVVYTSFTVKLNGKELGVINRSTTRYGEQAIFVSCKRIKDKMERKEGYVTKDAKKAIAKVRKEFAPKTTKEIIDEAREKASDVARTVWIQTDSQMRKATGTIQAGALDFFANGPGLEIYKSYLRADRPDDAKVLEAMDKTVELSLELMTIKNVKDKMGEGTALVVLDEGKYLVKILNDTQIYSDTTLPENLRGKLGLLKLVEPKQFISNTGFRASDEIFIIDLAQA